MAHPTRVAAARSYVQPPPPLLNLQAVPRLPNNMYQQYGLVSLSEARLGTPMT